MTQVIQYYAKGRPPGRSARSPASYPYRASVEHTAMAGFGAGLAGVFDEEVNRRHDILAQNEYSIGKAAFVQDMINAQEEFRNDKDYGTYVERFRKRTEQAQKDILEQAILPSSKQRLGMMMLEATPGNVSAISDLAWDGKVKHDVNVRKLNIENWKEIIANTQSEDVARNLMGKMTADILEDPLLTPEEAQLAAKDAQQDAMKRRAPIVELAATESVRQQGKTFATLDEAMDFIDASGLSTTNKTWLKTAEKADRDRAKAETDQAYDAGVEAVSDDMINGVVSGDYDVNAILLNPNIKATDKKSLVADYKALSTATVPEESDFDAVDRVIPVVFLLRLRHEIAQTGVLAVADKAQISERV